MKKILILLILLNSCSLSTKENEVKIPNISYFDNLTLDKFRSKLLEYAIKSPYPNIDN